MSRLYIACTIEISYVHGGSSVYEAGSDGGKTLGLRWR